MKFSESPDEIRVEPQADAGSRSVSFFSYKLVSAFVGIAIFVYVRLAIYSPTISAILNAVLIVTATGLFTTKILFNFQSTTRILLLTPLLGLAWLVFFYLVWLTVGLLH